MKKIDEIIFYTLFIFMISIPFLSIGFIPCYIFNIFNIDQIADIGKIILAIEFGCVGLLIIEFIISAVRFESKQRY